jgi:hypothetical protein
MSLAVCTLTKNWHEIPDIVSFCNDHEISICFNTVYGPAEYSLRCLPKFILERIIEYYKKVELPLDTPLQRRNRQCFVDLINQLDSWSNEVSVQEALSFHLEEKLETVLIAATSEIPAGRLHRERIVEDIVKCLLKYLSYRREVNSLEPRGKATENIKATINRLIDRREILLLALRRIANDSGYDYFVEMYIKALCTLNTLLNGGQENKHFTNKTAVLFEAVRSYRRKTMIIDLVSWDDPLFTWDDPLFTVNTIAQMSLKQIEEYFESVT